MKKFFTSVLATFFFAMSIQLVALAPMVHADHGVDCCEGIEEFCSHCMQRPSLDAEDVGLQNMADTSLISVVDFDDYQTVIFTGAVVKKVPDWYFQKLFSQRKFILFLS